MLIKINCVMLLFSFFMAPIALHCVQKKEPVQKTKKTRKKRQCFIKPRESNQFTYRLNLKTGVLNSYGQTPEEYAKSRKNNSSKNSTINDYNPHLSSLIQPSNKQEIAQQKIINPISYSVILNFDDNSFKITPSTVQTQIIQSNIITINESESDTEQESNEPSLLQILEEQRTLKNSALRK